MKIVLNPTTTRKNSKHKLQARFDKLRQQLLKQQNLNRKFQEELDELVSVYQTQLFQMDRELLAPLTLLAAKLIDFYNRKSLAQWQREELGEWIMETIGRIDRVEPDTAKKLHSRVRQAVANQMGMTEAELDEEARRYAAAAKAAYETFENTESREDANDPQEDMFGFDDVCASGSAEEDFFNGDDPFGHKFEDKSEANSKANSEDTETRRQRLMDGSWVRNLFRRAAQALHPDREPDPERRQAKERAMQQLLEARKQGDIMTLLQLYGECISGDDLLLAEQEMSNACELLQEQLHGLRAEKAAFIYQHPLRTQVHDLLYSGSQKAREKRLQRWKQDLKAEAEHTFTLIEELRNLTVLKAVLEERRELQLFDHLDLIFDGRW